MSKDYYIENHPFDEVLVDRISGSKYSKEKWPIVYILSDGEISEAYVGETTDVISRMSTHQKTKARKRLTSVHLIESEKFNKSATLDIEANLIRYIAGDGRFQLQNGNLGIANHNYFQKDDYWRLFTQIWDDLRAQGISRNSLETIDNSDLFKYSPYKTLSNVQLKGLHMIIDNLINGTHKSIVINGSAGTGKTVLAVFLFKLIMTELEDLYLGDLGKDENRDLLKKVLLLKEKFNQPKIALVVPMSSFRNTLKKVFAKVKGLKASMVVGPSAIAYEKFDLVVVDEAHRLRRRKNLTNYKSFDDGNGALGLDKHEGNELDWVRIQSKVAVYFYDPAQSIKPTDVLPESFERMIKEEKSQVLQLTSQFRVKGGNGYVEFIDSLLKADKTKLSIYNDKDYDVKLFDDFASFVEQVKQKDAEQGLSRMIAGYSWEWQSKTNQEADDIEIEGVALKWNRTNADWINSEGSLQEVGCIHTTQGYDLNYAGIIFGHEIGYDPEEEKLVVYGENYHDRNGRAGIKDPDELRDYILNIYKTILLRGIKGTYIYACNPELRKYLSQFVPVYGADIAEEETVQKEIIPFENSVPFYDLEAAAGDFSELQQVSQGDFILVPDGTRVSNNHFACRVVGESMNRIIPNGSICLFKKYTGGTRNGLIVLAQSSELHNSEMGSGYTVKEYHSKKTTTEEGWQHEKIVLRPLSFDKTYEDLELDGQELSDFQVVGIFERVIE